MSAFSTETAGARYASARTRLTTLLDGLSEDEWNAPVDACPGWRVRDVLAHLVGVIEDALAGKITGPPSDAQTADEVDRHRDDEPAALLASWSAYAEGGFEDAITDGRMWPAFLDALAHEHDILHALGHQGEQAHDDVMFAATLLTDPIRLPDGSVIEFVIGASNISSDESTYRLVTTAFELFRLRLGRRSADQVRAMSWSQDPSAVLDHVFIFGPRPNALVE